MNNHITQIPQRTTSLRMGRLLLSRSTSSPLMSTAASARWWARLLALSRLNGLRLPAAAPHLVLALLALSLLSACKTATVTNQQTFAPYPASKPDHVYVADFELGAEQVQHEPGVLPENPGPVGRVETRLSGASPDSEARAHQLVDLMAQSLVSDLGQAGFTASRLAPGTPPPRSGWLLRGVFTEVQEGNRLRRAVIGFGSGQTDLQIVAVVDDLRQGPPNPLYKLDTEARSGQAPGAAPTVVLTPYAAAARFVLAGQDLDKNVKQTATRIVDQLVKRIQPPPAQP